MKIRILIVSAIILSAIGGAFPSNLQIMKTAVERDSKCRVPTFQEAFQDAKAVFVGEILSEEKNGDTRTFEFKVEEYWKGSDNKNIKIDVYETMRYQAWFKTGERYLVYADEDNTGHLRVGRCSRSREVSNASEDLTKLGKGQKPRK